MPTLRDHARAMRQQPTSAENKLWQALRAKQILGRKWRRQVPLGPYIADFFCPELRLVVEVDGATHAEGQDDDARDAWLRARGYDVLRLWNNEVLGSFSGVQERIAAHPSPNPLPHGEGVCPPPNQPQDPQ